MVDNTICLIKKVDNDDNEGKKSANDAGPQQGHDTVNCIIIPRKCWSEE